MPGKRPTGFIDERCSGSGKPRRWCVVRGKGSRLRAHGSAATPSQRGATGSICGRVFLPGRAPKKPRVGQRPVGAAPTGAQGRPQDTAGRRGTNRVAARGRRRRLRLSGALAENSAPKLARGCEGKGEARRESQRGESLGLESSWRPPGARDNKSAAEVGKRHLLLGGFADALRSTVGHADPICGGSSRCYCEGVAGRGDPSP